MENGWKKESAHEADREARSGLAFSHSIAAPGAERPTGLRGRLTVVATRVRESAWAALGGRAVLVVTGLVVLACIGRFAGAPRGAPAQAPTFAAAAVESTTPPAPPTPAASTAESAAPAPPPVLAPTPTAAPAPAAVARGRATVDNPVYVNHASTEELRRLPGVGPKRAEAIVALRQRMGHFQRIEDLLRVKGIGRSTLRKWRPLLRLDTPDGGAP